MKKYFTIIAVLLASLVISCNNKNNNATGSKSKFASADCNMLNGFLKAIPQLENYREYQLEKVTCLPESKSYFLVYVNEKDSFSRISVELRDCRVKENELFLQDIKQSFDNAERNYNRFEKSSLTGQFTSIYKDTITESGHIMANSKFNTVLKGQYSLTITVKEKTSPGIPPIFDYFTKEFAAKIDTASLK